MGFAGTKSWPKPLFSEEWGGRRRACGHQQQERQQESIWKS